MAKLSLNIQYYFLFGFLLSVLNVAGQEKTIVVGGTSAAIFSNGVNINSKINEIAYQKKMIGSFYLNENWQKTNLFFDTDSLRLTDISTRLDLRNNVVEIKTGNDTLVLPTYRVKKIIYPKNNKIYVTENIVKSREKGFYELVVDRNYSLLRKFQLKIEPADYNIITNTGSKDDKITKKEIFYIYSSKGLIKINTSKSKFKKQFSKVESIQEFFENTKIKPRKLSFLIEFISYVNNKNCKFI